MINKKLCMIAPEDLDSKEFFGYHREVVYDIVFGGGVCVEDTFKIINYPDLTLEEAKAFFDAHYRDNPKLMRSRSGKPFFDGKDLYLLNRYITQYTGVPLYYDTAYSNPVNNRVADQVADFLMEVKGWAKVQNQIICSDPDCYRRFFDYASKGYFIKLTPYELHFDYGQDKFISISNTLRERLYYEDKEVCDSVARNVSTFRDRYFMQQVVEDRERRNRAIEEERSRQAAQTTETEPAEEVVETTSNDGETKLTPDAPAPTDNPVQ